MVFKFLCHFCVLARTLTINIWLNKLLCVPFHPKHWNQGNAFLYCLFFRGVFAFFEHNMCDFWSKFGHNSGTKIDQFFHNCSTHVGSPTGWSNVYISNHIWSKQLFINHDLQIKLSELGPNASCVWGKGKTLKNYTLFNYLGVSFWLIRSAYSFIGCALIYEGVSKLWFW